MYAILTLQLVNVILTDNIAYKLVKFDVFETLISTYLCLIIWMLS